MNYLGAFMLAATLLLGFGLAQTTEQTHVDHDQTTHDEMDHSEHTMEDSAEAHNTVSVEDATLVLEPLISSDGMLTLGIISDASAELRLGVTSPSGDTRALEAVPLMATRDEGHLNGDEHAEEDDHDGEMTHGGEDTENHGEGETPSVEAKTSEIFVFSLGAVEEGTWRFSGTLGDADVAFPLSVYRAATETTDVYLALAPSPALRTRALAEAFVYAFRGGEAIHNAIMMTREMAGMQHSTDEDQLALRHNHFNEHYNEILGYAPMANQHPLTFAMAGTWTVEILIMDDPAETLDFEVQVLDD